MCKELRWSRGHLTLKSEFYLFVCRRTIKIQRRQKTKKISNPIDGLNTLSTKRIKTCPLSDQGLYNKFILSLIWPTEHKIYRWDGIVGDRIFLWRVQIRRTVIKVPLKSTSILRILFTRISIAKVVVVSSRRRSLLRES